MADYLLEFGTEELPPFSIKPAVLKLKEEFENLFKEEKIEFKNIKVFGSPRRLAILIENISEKQKEYEEEIKGPPINIAFNERGEKSEVLKKFLESNKSDEKSIYIKEIEGKKYVFIKVKKGGKDTRDIIKENIMEIIKKIPFPKKMKWNSENLTFARPIRWILSLWNKEILELSLPIKTSNKTRGNRLFGNKIIEINSIEKYEESLKKEGVVPSFDERKKIILEKINIICEKLNAEPVIDDNHLEELTGLVEYPGVILCEFPEKYLEIPKEVIFTAMKSHQRYIPLISKDKRILPYFIAVINNKEEKENIIKKGLIDVLIARLEDAKFYIEKDNEILLEERINLLKEIVWIKGLGSIYDKNLRVKSLFNYFINNSNIKISENKEFLEKIIELLRTDLTTEMVRDGKEFTELEGIIASEYARIQKKDEKTIKILREYRLPKFYKDELPETKEGILISLSDKIDTAFALFVSGYKIKGSKDPMGLKRNLYSFFYLITEKQIKFDLEKIVEFSLNLFENQKIRIKSNKEEITLEILKRFENFLEEFKGIRYDIVDAIIESDTKDLYIIYKKASVLKEFLEKEWETFEKVIIGQKRVFNIIKNEKTNGRVKEDLFEKEEEKVLYNALMEIEPLFIKNLEKENFEDAFRELLKLREPIDKFFDNVFVMTDNKEIRENRLNLLKRVWEVFKKYGNLSKIVI
ncbi:MAG: glycine--tRNA ligase subunit beta [candidate division WOR-3 bacterium]